MAVAVKETVMAGQDGPELTRAQQRLFDHLCKEHGPLSRAQQALVIRALQSGQYPALPPAGALGQGWDPALDPRTPDNRDGIARRLRQYWSGSLPRQLNKRADDGDAMVGLALHDRFVEYLDIKTALLVLMIRHYALYVLLEDLYKHNLTRDQIRQRDHLSWDTLKHEITRALDTLVIFVFSDPPDEVR